MVGQRKDRLRATSYEDADVWKWLTVVPDGGFSY